ncbi:uncharacterized protein LOC144227413 [Crocuta crocuta]
MRSIRLPPEGRRRLPPAGCAGSPPHQLTGRAPRTAPPAASLEGGSWRPFTGKRSTLRFSEETVPVNTNTWESVQPVGPQGTNCKLKLLESPRPTRQNGYNEGGGKGKPEGMSVVEEADPDRSNI